MKNIILLILLVSTLTSCKLGEIIQAVDRIESKEVVVKTLSTFDNKRIKLIPMSHIGQPEFYATLKDSIAMWRSDGYRMYYEEMNQETSRAQFGDEITDISLKKWRRIQGGDLGTRKDLEDLKQKFDNAVIQPEWIDMGIDDTDLNADINITILVREYEKLYGEIKLTDCDYNTEIEEAYTCSKKYKNSIQPLIHGVRNQTVIDFINSEGDDKIVVLYGMRHMKALEKMIKKRK